MPFKIDELYYEMDARTAGFENRITHAQTSVDNFAKFIRDKPMLAVAALGAAMLAVAADATKMASDLDTSMRKVQAAFPPATAEMAKLRGQISLLATETPRSQKELADAAAAIAARGVESVDELIGRLRTTVLIADATGEALETVSDGLDTISDAFRLTSKEASEAVVQIFGFTQGKIAISEVFQTLQRGGAVLADLGVKAGDAGQAMVALIDAGIPRRQAGVVLTTILELTNRVKELRRGTDEQVQAAGIIEGTLSRGNIQTKGFITALGELATGLEKAGIDTRELGIRSNTLTAITRVAEQATRDHRTEAEKLASAHAKLAAAADVNRSSAQALGQILKNELNESLLNLGNKILPYVIKGLDGLTDAFRRLRGEGNPVKDIETLTGKLPTAGRLGKGTLGDLGLRNVSELLRGPTKESHEADTFYSALDATARRAQKYGADAFAGLSVEKLQQLQGNLKTFLASHPEEVAGQAGKVGQNLSLMAVALNQAIVAARAATATGGTTTAPAKTVDHVTQEVKDAIAAFRLGVEDAIAGETSTKIDDARIKVQRFREEVAKLERKAGGPLPDLQRELARMEKLPEQIEKAERAVIARSVADEAAKALGVQSVAMQVALDDFNEKAQKANDEARKLHLQPFFSREQIQQINDVRNALIEAAKETEATDALLLKLRVDETGRSPLNKGSSTADRRGEVAANVDEMLQASDRLQAQRKELAALSGATDAPSVARKRALLQDIERLQSKINELTAKNQQIDNEENAAILQRIALMEQMAQSIGAATSLAAELAGAFGGSGQAISGIISKIGGIASAVSSVKPFLSALDVFKSGKKDEAGNPLMSLGGLIGKASPIIGGISAGIGLIGGLLGKDPAIAHAQAETQAAMKTLTSALLSLRDTYLQNVSTSDSQKDLANVVKVLSTYDPSTGTFGGKRVLASGEGKGPGRRGNLRDIGSAFGQDFDSGDLLKYLQDMDKRYGTNLASFVEREDPAGLLAALQKVPDALKGELQNLGRYANTAAGVIDRVNYQFAVLGKTNAAEKFKAIIDALVASGQNLGDFAGTFATLNSADSTAEQRQKAIEDALAKLTGGGAINFGTLTAEQIRQLLAQGADAFRTQTAGTGGFNVNQQITEVRGARIDALLTTGNIYLSHIDQSTAIIARLLGGTLPSGIAPPNLPSDTGGGTTMQFDITVNVNAAVADPLAAGAQIGQGIITELNSQLGTDQKWRARAAGSTLII
jgi:TP901 family phage tail tape measure protein